MKFSNALAVGTAICSLVLSASVLAEVPDAGAAPAQSGEAPAASPQAAPQSAAPGGAQTGTSYSDAEVQQFAKAVIAIQQIQKDPAVAAADKQTKMAAAVQAAGLTPEKFNAIASASNSDPTLMQRIQVAASQAAGPAAQ